MRSVEGRIVELGGPAFGGRELLWLNGIDVGGGLVGGLGEGGRFLLVRIRIGIRVLRERGARRGRLIVRRRGGRRLC